MLTDQLRDQLLCKNCTVHHPWAKLQCRAASTSLCGWERRQIII